MFGFAGEQVEVFGNKAPALVELFEVSEASRRASADLFRRSSSTREPASSSESRRVWANSSSTRGQFVLALQGEDNGKTIRIHFG